MLLKKIPLDEINENYLQSNTWANVKNANAAGSPWTAFAVEFTNEGERGKILVLKRKLKFNIYFAYIANPSFSNIDIKNIDFSKESKFLKELSISLKKYLKGQTIFVRYDLNYFKKRTLKEPFNDEKYKLRGLFKAFDDIQPKSTTKIDLSESEEALLSNMKKKTRYNIKLALRKNLEIKIDENFEELEDWYNLHLETAKRDKFKTHSYSYIKNVVEQFKKDKNAKIFLILAFFNNELIAGIVVLVYKSEATYLYGASKDKYRNLMPNYLIQWEAIKLSKREGALTYDFLGIPESSSKRHPMFGLFQFKTSFNGALIHRLGCFDYAYNKWLYLLYSLLERLRYFYYKVLRKIF